MSNDRYEKIRKALAMGPTPGPWVPKELPRDMQHDGYRFSVSRGGLDWWMIAKVTHEAACFSGAANAAMIAACDPDTIRELLAERDQLAAEIEVLRAEVERDKALLAEDDAWCAECGVKLENVRPGKHQHPTCSQAQPLTDEALLREALYALEYASDLTKLEDLQGCGCPICTNIAALRERLGLRYEPTPNEGSEP